MLNLTENEKRDIVRYIEEGKELPEKYRFHLFEDKKQLELLWNGKTDKVTNVVFPFQTIEHVDTPRSEVPRELQLSLFDESGRQQKGWHNKIIWGDNKNILSSLKHGPMREEIKEQGGIKLIYIDPPFDVGADFTMDVKIGDQTLEKKPNVLEHIAYRDTWGLGRDSFLSMIYERIILMKDLLADDGSIFIHCDWRSNTLIKAVMDEVFGRENFRNEIIWTYTGPGSPGMKQFNRKHDNIYWYTKSKNWTFNSDEIKIPSEVHAGGFKDKHGKGDMNRNVSENYSNKGKIPEDWWNFAIAARIKIDGTKRTGYPTEKPNKLIERIIKAASNEEDIVCDFFAGSGSLAYNCSKLNRKWIVSDIGKFSVHTIRKRMLLLQREMKKEGKNYKPIEILNLGKYEKQHFIKEYKNIRDKDLVKKINQKNNEFINLILGAYNSESVDGFKTFHGKKAGRMVSIGPVNFSLSRKHVEEVISECLQNQISKVDILGFEYEMGLFPTIQDEAKKRGIDLAYKQIPVEVFDKRAVAKGEEEFHDVAYIEFTPIIKGNTLAVKLTDFSVSYQQGQLQQTEESLKNKQSRIIVQQGQIVKLSKDANGIITQEQLTKQWTDWIDYWSVDFDFKSKQEIIREPKEGNPDKFEQKWTGDFVFENNWQSFRTKDQPSLELTSSTEKISKNKTTIAVKVVDIFGNDTMKIMEVNL